MLGEAISKYLRWIGTWRQGRGLYGGIHIHICWEVDSVIEKGYQGVTVSDYIGLMNGFLELHKKTGERRFLDESIDLAYALKSLQDEGGCFEHSVAEFEPGKGGCIHNALADIALLSLSDYLIKNGKDVSEYLNVVRRSFEWFMDFWWKRGNRWMKNPDFPCWCGVTNQDLAVCWAMAYYAKLNMDEYWRRYGLPVAEWYIKNYYYPEYKSYFRGDAPDFPEPASYNGLIDYELIHLYLLTGNKEFLRIALENIEYLEENSWRDEYGFIRIHNNLDLKEKKIIRRPSIINQSSLISALQMLEELGISSFRGFKEDLLKTILFYQSDRGYFRNSTDHDNFLDIVSTTGSGVLEALTRVWNGNELPSQEVVEVGIDYSGRDIWIDTDEYWQLHRGDQIVGGVKADPNGIYFKPLIDGVRKVKVEKNAFTLKIRGFKSISIDHILESSDQIIIDTDREATVSLKLSDGRRVKEVLDAGKNVIRYSDF